MRAFLARVNGDLALTCAIERAEFERQRIDADDIDAPVHTAFASPAARPTMT
jgi:hypothetical protein